MPHNRPLGRLLRAVAPSLAARRREEHERRFYGRFVSAGALCGRNSVCFDGSDVSVP